MLPLRQHAPRPPVQQGQGARLQQDRAWVITYDDRHRDDSDGHALRLRSCRPCCRSSTASNFEGMELIRPMYLHPRGEHHQAVACSYNRSCSLSSAPAALQKTAPSATTVEAAQSVRKSRCCCEDSNGKPQHRKIHLQQHPHCRARHLPRLQDKGRSAFVFGALRPMSRGEGRKYGKGRILALFLLE